MFPKNVGKQCTNPDQTVPQEQSDGAHCLLRHFDRIFTKNMVVVVDLLFNVHGKH